MNILDQLTNKLNDMSHRFQLLSKEIVTQGDGVQDARARV